MYLFAKEGRFIMKGLKRETQQKVLETKSQYILFFDKCQKSPI